MRRFLNIVKWAVTLGSEPQNFLGARWIVKFLQVLPQSQKRVWALRLLSMSPHYFIDQANLGSKIADEGFLEHLSDTLTRSREQIVDGLLKPQLDSSFEVIDYGCGPGYLAKAVSPLVKKIYAVDISGGALACAEVINGADNIDYILAGGQLSQIPDHSIDAVYSFAVVQHLTDQVFNDVLSICNRKLKPEGSLILHIQLPDEVWQSQSDWEKDRSLRGRVKYRYGLHCFGRTEEEYRDFVRKAGFTDIRSLNIADIFPNQFDELVTQRLLLAKTKRAA